ncbi:ACP phosphodiesterase [bacterium]|nr:ACP phosphodiesterase [bacterium]
MIMPHSVAVLVGSLRRDSYSQRLAGALMTVAPEALKCRIVPIADLPLYNDDLSSDPPPAWTAFRQAIRAAQGLLVVTPEYNRSMPGGLKNAIDVGSRPWGMNVFDAMPSAVVSHSPGPLGGFGANHALRQSMVTLNMLTLQQPEAYISHVASLFDPAGTMTSAPTRAFLGTFMTAFARWIDLNSAPQQSPVAE